MDNNFQSWSLETMKFHITIDQLLKTIQAKIDKLPDDKDFSELSKQLKDVIDNIEEINSIWSLHTVEFDKIKVTVYDLKKLLDNITSTINLIPVKNKEINDGLETILILVDLFNQELAAAKIRLRNEMFTLSDFNEIIILARRLNERHDTWKGWKGKVAIALGVTLGGSALIQYIIDLINLIKQTIP